MKAKVKGIEAAAAGLARSGIRRVQAAAGKLNPRIVDSVAERNIKGCISESVPNAQEAIGMGYYFAEKGYKTVSFIEENKLFFVAEIMNTGRKIKAAYVIVVMEQQERCSFTEILYAYGIHFWVAPNSGSINEILYDATIYSEAYGKPVVIFYPHRFLICDAVIDIKNIVYTDNLFSAGMKERMKKKRMIQKSYNRELSHGKYAIAVSGELAGMVCSMTEDIPDVSVIALDMYYPELSLYGKYEKMLLVQKAEPGNGTKLYEEADMKVKLPVNFYSWEKLLFHSIADYLNGHELPEYFGGKAWQRNYDEMLKIRRPETEDSVYRVRGEERKK